MEDCMSSIARMTPEQRKRLISMVLHSLRQEPEAWQQEASIQWYHEGLDIDVTIGLSEIMICDRRTCSYLVRRPFRAPCVFRTIFGSTDIDRIWDILHSWRHRQVEAQGEAILARFERNRTAPEVSRLKELVDATRG